MRENYLLVTPENVPISYELAGVGSRFVAALLDALITLVVLIGLLVMSLIIAWAFNINGDGLSWLAAIGMLLSFAIALGYPLFFEIAWSGQTPGKRRTGIRIVRDDGAPITATAVLIRNVIRLADFLPAYYIIGAVVMLIDRKSRRLGDLAAGTICVKERRDVTADRLSPRGAARLQETILPDQPPMDGLARLSPEDYHLVREYLLRRDKLAPGAAQDLATRIAGRIAARLEVDLDHEPADVFLERVSLGLEQHTRPHTESD